MSDRLKMPSMMSAEAAERLSDQSTDVTDADEDAAIAAIINDYLLLGYSYPRRGRNALRAGHIIREYASEEELADMLTALVYGCGDQLEQQNDLAERLVKDRTPEYLRTKRPDLIETMLEEMADE